VFIDELDAVGRQRGVRMGLTNDEREQTLNQLLVGMDGFEANLGVVVLGATNRPEVLDRALLRPDRQIVVDAPDLDGRDAILRLHARGKPLAPDVDLHRIAQATPGFSGADLANVVNEAALLAARNHEFTITQKDLEDAVESSPRDTSPDGTGCSPAAGTAPATPPTALPTGDPADFQPPSAPDFAPNRRRTRTRK